MGLILITNKPTNGFYKAVNDIPTNQWMDYMYIYIHVYRWVFLGFIWTVKPTFN